MHNTDGLDRRTFLTAVLATPALMSILGACASTAKTAGTGNSSSIKHATGKHDLVLRIGFEGGFTAPSAQFIRVPTLLISGDGRLITAGAQTLEFPGPLLPPLFERTISEAGMQKVLELADNAHLLQPPPDYTAPMTVADAPDTVVIVSANGQTFKHVAYALGMGNPEKTPARTTLAAFVAAMQNIETAVGTTNLGIDKPMIVESYRIQASAINVADIAGQVPAPQVVEWPATAGVTLASASTCAIVAATNVGSVLQAATQTTVFSDGGTMYRVAAVANLPGDAC
jgi:hypothetical protein